MKLRTLVFAFVALVTVSVLLTLVSLVVGLLTALLVKLVTLAVLVLALIGAYRVFAWSRRRSASDDDERSSAPEPTTEDRLERLRERYIDGELTESEYERNLELLLGAEEFGPVDGLRDRDRERDPSVSRRY